jgi:hypothetical protein
MKAEKCNHTGMVNAAGLRLRYVAAQQGRYLLLAA